MVLVDCHMPKVGLYSAFSLKKTPMNRTHWHCENKNVYATVLSVGVRIPKTGVAYMWC